MIPCAGKILVESAGTTWERLLTARPVGVVGEFEPICDLNSDFRTESIVGIMIRLYRLGSSLVIEIAGKEEIHSTSTSAYAQVVVVSRTGIVEHIIVPVEIGVVFIYTILLDNPRSRRIFHFVVTAYPQFVVVLCSVSRVRCTLIGTVEHIIDICAVVASGLEIC